MSGWQKNLKKDFSLGQYYTQLQKYEAKAGTSKSKPLKKDISLSSFAKDTSKPFSTYHKYKQPITIQRPKLDLTDKYEQKLSYQNYENSKIQSLKKNKPKEDYKRNAAIVDSLANSGVSSKQWLVDSEIKEKQNLLFSTKDEKTFVQRCTKLYELQDTNPLVDALTREINKRDEVYELVAQQFEGLPEDKYKEQLEAHFREHQLMKDIIAQFKSMSKLQIEDLSELYYFLKTER